MPENEIIPSGADPPPLKAPPLLAPTAPAGVAAAGDRKSNVLDEKAAKATEPAPPTESAAPRKIGEGHAEAMLRLGAKELAQALQAFPDSNIRPIEEPGAFGNTTPQVVTKQMGYEKLREGFANRPTPERDTEQDKAR